MQSKENINKNTFYLRRGSLLEQGFLLVDRVHGVVHERHVDVDGMHPRDAVLHPERLHVAVLAADGGRPLGLQALQGVLGLLTRLVLDKAPSLDHPVLDGYLQEGWAETEMRKRVTTAPPDLEN